MKDIIGNDLKEGQKVATNISGYTDQLYIATIIGFTEQKVKLKLKRKEDTFYKYPYQIIVATKLNANQ